MYVYIHIAACLYNVLLNLHWSNSII